MLFKKKKIMYGTDNRMAGRTRTVGRQKGEEKREDEKAGGEGSAERQPRTTHTGAAQSLHGAREKKREGKQRTRQIEEEKKRPRTQ